MKKLSLSLLLLSLMAAGCNYQSAVNQNSNSNQNANTNTAPTEQLQTYNNSTYGVTFQYPQTMNFVTPTYALLQDKITELQIPQSAYPKTNFGDAAFSVSAAYAKDLATCLTMNPPENASGFKNQTQINGQTFYLAQSMGAAAGNRYDSTVYRTLSGKQTCIEVSETIHTSNIGNYPAGTVTEVNQGDVQSRLDAVLQTFKINK